MSFVTSKPVISDSDFGNNDQDNPVSLRERLGLILNLSESMLSSAKNEQWGALIELGAERQRYLDQFSASAAAPADVPWFRLSLERVREIDQQIIQMSENTKQLLAETNKKGKSATKAYSRNNRLS